MIPSLFATERLLVRPFEARDAAALADLYADAETMRFVGGVRTLAQVVEEIEYTAACFAVTGLGARAVVRREDGFLVGRCGLWLQAVDGEREVEIGYLLGRRYWGNGYATEAARGMRDAALAAGHDRLISIVHPDNVASARVALRNGMRPEKDTVWDDKPARIYVYGSSR